MAGRENRRAVANGNAIMLVEADGSTLTLRAEPNGAGSADEPVPTAKA